MTELVRYSDKIVCYVDVNDICREESDPLPNSGERLYSTRLKCAAVMACNGNRMFYNFFLNQLREQMR